VPSSAAPHWMYLKSPQKNFWHRLYNFLCLKLRRHLTESQQISTKCTEMIANYSLKIKIAIFQSVSERQGDKWKLSSNCGRKVAKIAHFNSVNSEFIGRKFTKYLHNIATRVLPFNLLKAASWSLDPLSNATAKSKGLSWLCLRTSHKFNWLPWQHP